MEETEGRYTPLIVGGGRKLSSYVHALDYRVSVGGALCAVVAATIAIGIWNYIWRLLARPIVV